MKQSIFLCLYFSLFLVSLLSVNAQLMGQRSDTLRLTSFKIEQNERDLLKNFSDRSRMSNVIFFSPQASQISILSTSNTLRPVVLSLPISKTKSLRLILKQVSIFDNTFTVTTSSGNSVTLPLIHYYQGKVAGDTTSTVSITATEMGLDGTVMTKAGVYTIRNLSDVTTTRVHAVVTGEEAFYSPVFQCESSGIMMTDTAVVVPQQEGSSSTRQSTSSDCRKVNIYFEADHLLYQQLESNATAVTSQVASLFNQIATLYANEGVIIQMGGLKIWDTADPYASSTNSSQALTAFRDHWRGQNNSFNGDIAHLLTGKSIGGRANFYFRKNNPKDAYDIASVFALPAYRSGAYGVSGVDASWGEGIGWAVKLVSHEIGHSFGLPHTHSCLWEGGPIDNCATQEGECPPGNAPENGTGTIMSYCAYDLAKGFGPQPSAKLRHEFLIGEALANPGQDAPLVAPQNSTVLKGQSLTLTASNCNGSLVWSDGITTTSISRTITPMVSRVYAVSCLRNGCLSSPAIVKVAVTCATALACTVTAPQGKSPYVGIHEFSLHTLGTSDFYGSPANLNTNYEDFTCEQNTTLEVGNSYAFNIRCTFGNSAFAKLYIDYNGDGIFNEQDERVYSSPGRGTRHTGTVSLPASALRNVPLRIRIVLDPNSSLSACSLPGDAAGSGKANDYLITIVGPTCPLGVRETVQSGNWSDPSIWSCGIVPIATDQVKINPNHVISLPPGLVAEAGTINLLGNIQFGSEASVRLSSHN
jgi:hypothetical protein